MPKEKLSIPHFLAGFAANFFLSFFFGFILPLWCSFVVVVCLPVLWMADSRSTKSVAFGFTVCTGLFILFIILWMLLQLISPA